MMEWEFCKYKILPVKGLRFLVSEMHLKCKWIEVGEANFSYFRLRKLYFTNVRLTNYTTKKLHVVSSKIVKNKLFSNYRQIVMLYILDIYTWDLTVTEIQLDNKNKLIGFIIFSKKTGTFVNRVWIDTRLYIFICCFGLVSSWMWSWKKHL